MTTPLGQLAQPYFCFPSSACGVQFFRDRPVCSERLRRVARREPGPPRVRQKLGAEERVQGGRGGRLVRRRRVLGPERILVRRAEQAVRLRSKVFVGLGRRPLEHLDRLLGLALREPGLCEQDAGLLGPVGPGKVLHHLGQYAGGERVVLRVEREAPLSDLATGASLRRLRGQEVPCEESQRHDERHGEICRRLLVIPDPVGERLQPVGLSNHRASCRRYRRPHTRSEEHTSELQSHSDLVCRLLLEKKKTKKIFNLIYLTNSVYYYV